MEKIVVGIDGSDASKDALRWAVEEARLRSARVVALHAYDVPLPAPDVGPAPRFDVVDVVSEIHERALKLVSAVVEGVVGDDSTVTVEPIAVEGLPAQLLIDAARDAELLVVGWPGSQRHLARDQSNRSVVCPRRDHQGTGLDRV